jgi:CDP-paratose 2-epimerase
MGYHGKQVRDQIHCDDVANLFFHFFRDPHCGEVYNLGGGRANSVSILETIDMLAALGLRLKHRYQPQHRMGDHICYITDLSKLHAHYPEWKVEHDLPKIFGEIVDRCRAVDPV